MQPRFTVAPTFDPRQQRIVFVVIDWSLGHQETFATREGAEALAAQRNKCATTVLAAA